MLRILNGCLENIKYRSCYWLENLDTDYNYRGILNIGFVKSALWSILHWYTIIYIYNYVSTYIIRYNMITWSINRKSDYLQSIRKFLFVLALFHSYRSWMDHLCLLLPKAWWCNSEVGSKLGFEMWSERYDIDPTLRALIYRVMLLVWFYGVRLWWSFTQGQCLFSRRAPCSKWL